jgi:LDH2 family malate/lactate/ureidoglycolate dehydrogenase
MAWRIDAFRDPTDFFADLQAMLADLPATPPATADGTTHVLVPGDPEIAAERQNDLVVPANPGS